ncbi:hypothetical protein M5K25_001870 [Dendrobium thyrsiflorum]|uniref:Retrotransposon Copia-like N-terminal domain-containing protein n=1 Tax=Dendrobium thyrsiflorum TaxID=117978 RepID=A0ABD0W0Z1_DENTH
MADQDSSSAIPPTSSLSASTEDFVIPSPLKFLMSNLKLMVNLQLNNENYAFWSLQIYKLFAANGFEGYLRGHQTCPNEPTDQPDHRATMVPISWTEMQCPSTGQVEKRKVAKVV